MKKRIEFKQPVTVEFERYGDTIERTFIAGEIITGKITRETDFVADVDFHGDMIWSLPKSAFIFKDQKESHT